MSDDIKKGRSPSFPRVALEEAIALIKTLHAKAGKAALPPIVAVQALKYGSLNGAALGVLAALKQYGLLASERAGSVAVSPLALKLIHPLGPAQEIEARRESALYPPVYQALFSGGHYVCDEHVLTNRLIQEGFTPNGAARAASVFKQNVEFAKLAAARLDEPVSAPTSAASSSSELTSPPPQAVNRYVPPKGAFSPEQEIRQNELAIPLDEGQTARIPFPMSAGSYELLMQTLKLWKPRMVKSASVADLMDSDPYKVTE